MNGLKIAVLMTAVVGTACVLTGCDQAVTTTMAESKQAALDRWSATRAGITYSLALQQFEAGDFDKAEHTVLEAISANPSKPEFFVLAGRIAVEKGQLERGYHYMVTAIETDPEHAPAHYQLGVINQRWQKYDVALNNYRLASQYDPESVSGLIAEAEMLVKLNRDDEALKRLSRKLVYFDHNAAIRVSIGRICLMRGEMDRAVSMFNEAHLLAPEDPTVLQHLAMAEYSDKRYGEAIYHLQQLLETEGYETRRDLRTALGDCYQATGKSKEARLLFLSLTDEDPTDVNAWVKLGQAAWIVGDERRLRQSAQQINALAPDRFEGYLLAGMVMRNDGKNVEAIALFERASGLSPDSSLPHILRGMTLEDAGQITEAGSAYAAALRIDPTDQRAKRLLAGVESR